MEIDKETIHVNMEFGDAKELILNGGAYEMAGWLKDVYTEKYGSEYFLEQKAIAIELYAHTKPYNDIKNTMLPFTAEIKRHARVADIGDTYSFKDHWWERLAWDILGSLIYKD